MEKIKRIVSLLTDKPKYEKALNLLKMLFLNKTTKYPKEVLALENGFAKYVGTKYSLSFCNGTSAFDAAIFALGLEDGDNVLISSMSFHSVVMSLLQNRLTLNFLDIDEKLNVVLPEGLIAEKIKAIIVSHLFGYPQHIERNLKFAQKHGIKIIEDCSHAHGAFFNGEKVGTFGDIAFFSFQGDKAVSGGEAGFCTTNSKEYYDRMRLYSHMGRDMTDIDVDPLFKGKGYGRKGRMHPFAAALAMVDLKYLDLNNALINRNIRKFHQTVDCFDFVSIVTPNPESVLGGFHYGLPIWIGGDKTKIVKKRLLDSKEIIFREYPYIDYHNHDFFCDPQLFRAKIREIEFEADENRKEENFPMIESAIKNLIFLDINFLKGYNKKESKKISSLFAKKQNEIRL